MNVRHRVLAVGLGAIAFVTAAGMLRATRGLASGERTNVPATVPVDVSARAQASAPESPVASRRCFVALVHGSGPDLTTQTHPGAPLMERYWNPARDPAFTLEAQSHRPDTVANHCTLLRVGYDGGRAWWDIRASGAVAAALVEFIVKEHIPDGGLILVGHSMGGIVARYIVNNGVPQAPYYNEHVAFDERMDYALVQRKTGAIITVAAPHTGTESADALEGSADHVWGNVGATLLRALGVVRDSAANASLTRAVLEEAGSSGGDMGDEGRTVPIFTVAGIRPDPVDGRGVGAGGGAEATGAGATTRADRRLTLAWAMVCARPSGFNLWGLACGHTPWRFPALDGDGIVRRASAHGGWTRDETIQRQGSVSVAGPLYPWRDRPVNHSQSRYTAQSWALVAEVLATFPLESEPR